MKKPRHSWGVLIWGMLQGHYTMYSTTAKKEIIFFVFLWYLAGTIWLHIMGKGRKNNLGHFATPECSLLWAFSFPKCPMIFLHSVIWPATTLGFSCLVLYGQLLQNPRIQVGAPFLWPLDQVPLLCSFLQDSLLNISAFCVKVSVWSSPCFVCCFEMYCN